MICHRSPNPQILDNPSLAGKSFGVQGGVLSTASYEARKFGVRSGMAQYIAMKLCPHLIIVPSHFDRYTEMSKKVMDVLRSYDPQMMAAGQDEAYLK
jgi:DNA polymerase kappa